MTTEEKTESDVELQKELDRVRGGEAIDKMRAKAAQNGLVGMTDQAINAEIAAVRKARHEREG